MKSNQLIIFSKNRPSQLNLLIESIVINSNNIFDKIKILYKSDDFYKESYDFISSKFKDIVFLEEKNFKQDLTFLIEDSIDFTTFMVDDAVIYSKIDSNKEDILNLIDDETICFSLRLGLNCVFSHPANLKYQIKNYHLIGEFISIKFTDQEPGDFKYPFSTDGHIFNTKFIKNILNIINFNNPNTLESNLQPLLNFSNRLPQKIKFFKQSKVISIPVNLVNTTFNNRHALIYKISEKELEEKFKKGVQIDLEKLDFTNIDGPHKEINYKFK